MRSEDFQDQVLKYQREHAERMARMETKLDGLVGNGNQPGRIDRIEADVKQLQAGDNRRRGARHAIELGLGFLGGLLGGLLRHST